MEVIVPWDDSVPDMPSIARRFGSFRFLALGTVQTSRPKSGAAGQHELFDRRRAAGLGTATGEIVAILEDRGVPRPNWASTLARLHSQLPHAVIGGAIENARDSWLAWAVYFCDFGRYQLPFTAGPRAYVSDVNIGYKRRALDRTADLWKDRYHETTVHWALQRAGETLYLTPDLVVDQLRDGLRAHALIAERFSWGRLFAYTRARELTLAKRLASTATSPLLPVVLYARLARLQLDRRATRSTFLRVSPIVLLLLVSWSFGEAVGYLTGEP